MPRVNFRKWLYFNLVGLRGQQLGENYERFYREYQQGISPDITRFGLIKILDHCMHSVPYYAGCISELGDGFYEDPQEYLKNFPILTKPIIRSRFDDLKSVDLTQRKWYENTSGGSTGEPARFIQDWDYSSRSGALKLLYLKLVGCEVGDSVVSLWGSVRDITEGSETWQTRMINRITNTTFLNTFRMTPEITRSYLAFLNKKRPKLILAYADAIYNMARFAEREGIRVVPQSAVMTTAGTLYQFMREKIEQVFQCKVYNRYGSREVGDVAGEYPGSTGLWAAPWGTYIEIVDENGNRVPDGVEGEILVTSLNNFAMPLIRYRIGDRGILAPGAEPASGPFGQVIEAVHGRVDEYFTTKDGVLVKGGYFRTILYFYNWIHQYQIIQKSYTDVLFRIVSANGAAPKKDLDAITEKVRAVMGRDCQVHYEFPDEIPASRSGKFRFTISEVTH